MGKIIGEGITFDKLNLRLIPIDVWRRYYI